MTPGEQFESHLNQQLGGLIPNNDVRETHLSRYQDFEDGLL
ncbi:Predicted gene 884 [Apodemus speciosus]|uniref:Predicted gene 884 n=1 Tax=Apodemus speciosus TaxID=105296 RepID=A0ABQ0FCA4_APOSI